MSARQRPPIGRLEIFDGKIRAGVISRRDGRFVARDVNGRELGAFGTLKGAARAIPKISTGKEARHDDGNPAL
jgi:hypothetical protein